jgi:hypothetical protein
MTHFGVYVLQDLNHRSPWWRLASSLIPAAPGIFTTYIWGCGVVGGVEWLGVWRGRVDSTSACELAGLGSIPRPGTLPHAGRNTQCRENPSSRKSTTQSG